MNLWTEFEGVTIDSAFALTKLVQTEGRSAFFSTRNANGESVLIRIIECHFDEDEILARWRGLQTLSHPNFLRIDRFGQFYMAADDVTAVYVVFEHVDANLGEVLERGRLSAPEAAQIGLSVSSALETLHAAGFVHEHIETRNIFAVGDQVKLRSDCIRETPEGEAGMEARRRDVHGLAAVLMEVLLGKLRGSSAGNENLLPAQFVEVVRNGMNGSWGLREIKAALGRMELPKSKPQRSTRPDPAPSKPESLKPEMSKSETLRPAVLQAEPSAAQVTSTAASSGTFDFAARPISPDQNSNGRAAKPNAQPEQSNIFASRAAEYGELPRKKQSMELPVIFGLSEQEFRKWMSAGVLLLGVILIGWILVHHWMGHPANVDGQAVSPEAGVAGSHTASTPRTASSAVAAVAPRAGSRSKADSQSRMEWRVVAFTYKRQDQAQKKAESLGQQHPGLSPVVFSRNGKAPWLVTVGGVLQRDAAYGLARKARSLGLPRDTYAQNYTSR